MTGLPHTRHAAAPGVRDQRPPRPSSAPTGRGAGAPPSPGPYARDMHMFDIGYDLGHDHAISVALLEAACCNRDVHRTLAVAFAAGALDDDVRGRFSAGMRQALTDAYDCGDPEVWS